MSTVNYCASGFCHTPTKEDPRSGWGEFVIYNPMKQDARINMTVYFENKPLAQLSEFTVKAETNIVLVFPKMNMDVFKDCGFFGLKIASDFPVIVNNILLEGIEGKSEKYKGGVGDFLGNTRLSKIWYIADGLVLIHPEPFNELEWIHILNPTKRDAEVTMTCYYRDKTTDKLKFHIPAERVFQFNIEGKVKPNKGYGAVLESTEPIAVEQVRLIYSVKGINDWGLNIHFTLPGVPAPLKWNQEAE
jgi:hypothetical protein